VTVNAGVGVNGDVLANDTDPENNPLSVATVNGQAANVGATVQGTYGSLTIAANGQYAYVLGGGPAVQALAPGQVVKEVFRYTVSDGFSHPVSTTTITNQNLITQSEAFGSSAWLKFTDSGASPAVAANVAVGPQGTATTADQLTLSGANSGLAHMTDVSGQHTFSVWVRLVSGDGRLTLNYYDGGVTGVSQTFVATGAWQRVTLTFDGAGSPNGNVALMHNGVQSATGVFQVWGAQLNPGATPSAYLPTAGAPATTTTTTTTEAVAGADLTISITGATPERPPIALADEGEVSVAGAPQALGDVLANDSAFSGAPLTVVAVNGQATQVGATVQGTYGTLVLGADGHYTYLLDPGRASALAPGETARESFQYTVSDGDSYTQTTSVISGQNIIAQSEAFNSSAWQRFAVSGPAPTVTANVAAGPAGSAATADQVQLTGANSGLYYLTAYAGEQTFSLWVKLVSGDGRFSLNHYDGTANNLTTFVATSEWQRVSITFTGTGAASTNVAFMHGGAQSATGAFQLWGAQLNPGDEPGDYAPTAGHFNSVFASTTAPAVVTANLEITVSGQDPATAEALNFAGGSQGVVVDLGAGTWTHTMRVLPLGDSITYGWTTLDYQAGVAGPTHASNGYRAPLWWDFASEGQGIDFVGPETSGDSSLADRSHGGLVGFRSDQIAEALPVLLAAHRPDAILLMAGTNDIFQEVSPASHVAESLTTMIEMIASTSPSTHLYVATLTAINQAMDWQPGDAAMVAVVNAAIRQVVAEAIAAGHKVTLVDTSSITAGDLYDAAHPTPAGYAELAQIWFDAIVAAQPISGGTPGGDVQAVGPGVSKVTGSEANDFLIASGAGDTLVGGGGNDRLVGGGGADVLSGGLGADQFVFGPHLGDDLITDFNRSQGDHIQLQGISGLTQFSQLSGRVSVVQGTTVIDLSAFGSDAEIRIANFTGLSSGDVWFG
jgi:VCBS repeat-containing protein